eukprot:Opistho-2@44191
MQTIVKRVKRAMTIVEKFDVKKLDHNYKDKLQSQVPQNLHPELFGVRKTVSHGLPGRPTCASYDPVQSLLAVGTTRGEVRILGAPGVEFSLSRDDGMGVKFVLFVVNEGAVIAVHDNDRIDLWDLRGKEPSVVRTAQFKEPITCIRRAPNSRWLYIGTDKGNLHVLHLDTLLSCGYLVYWNHVIDVSRKTHPGKVVAIEEHPFEEGKLLVAHACGNVVLWDLKLKKVVRRYGSEQTNRGVTCASWHSEGSKFALGHDDGSMSVWQMKTEARPESSRNEPKASDAGRRHPISRLLFLSTASGEPFLIFSGGSARTDEVQYVTILQGKAEKVYCVDYQVIDMVATVQSPWAGDVQNPTSVICVMEDRILAIDLVSKGLPLFSLPYGLELHRAGVTALETYMDCPTEFIADLAALGKKQSESHFHSPRPWPVFGGVPPKSVPSPQDSLLVTGHEDGTLRFWDCSCASLDLLYSFSVGTLLAASSQSIQGLIAVRCIRLCVYSRRLTIALGNGDVLVFGFSVTHKEAPWKTCVISRRVRNDKVLKQQASKDSLRDARATALSPPPSAAPVGQSAQPFSAPASAPTPATTDPAAAARLERIGALKRLGFSEEWCVKAIGSTSGTMNEAAAWLFANAKTLEEEELDKQASDADQTKGRESAPPSMKTVTAAVAAVVATTPVGSPSLTRASTLPNKSPALTLSPTPARKEQQQPSASASQPDALRGGQSSSAAPPSSTPPRAMSPSGNAPDVSADKEKDQPSAPPVERVYSFHPGFFPICHVISYEWNTDLRVGKISALAAHSALGLVAIADAAGFIVVDVNAHKCILCLSHFDFPSRELCTESATDKVMCLSFNQIFARDEDLTDSQVLLVGSANGGFFVYTISESMSPVAGASSYRLDQAICFYFQNPSPILAIDILDKCGSPLKAATALWDNDDGNSPNDDTVAAGMKAAAAIAMPNTQRQDGCNAANVGPSICIIAEEDGDASGDVPPPPQPSPAVGSNLAAMSALSGSNVSLSAAVKKASGEHQFAVVTCAHNVRVVVLPGEDRLHKIEVDDGGTIVKSGLIDIGDESCLGCITNTGRFLVYGLLNLRPLLDGPCCDENWFGCLNRSSISRNGRVVLAAPWSQLQRVAVLEDDSHADVDYDACKVFLSKQMPPKPSGGLLRGMFGGASALDREELFGIPDPGANDIFARKREERASGNTERVAAEAGSIKGTLQHAQDALKERGEKLGQLENKSEAMRADAEDWVNKLKEHNRKQAAKKWYEL